MHSGLHESQTAFANHIRAQRKIRQQCCPIWWASLTEFFRTHKTVLQKSETRPATKLQVTADDSNFDAQCAHASDRKLLCMKHACILGSREQIGAPFQRTANELFIRQLGRSPSGDLRSLDAACCRVCGRIWHKRPRPSG